MPVSAETAQRQAEIRKACEKRVAQVTPTSRKAGIGH